MNPYTIYLLIAECLPVYVGQTSKPVDQRYRAHAKRTDFSPTNYAVLETCATLDEANVAEKKWIGLWSWVTQDSLWNLTEGGQGEWPPDMRPTICAKLSTAIKIALNRPDTKARHRATQNLPEVKAKKSASTRAHWQDPAARIKRSVVFSTPASKAKKSAAMLTQWQNPVVRARRSAAILEKWQNPDYRAKQLAARWTQFQSPSMRAKMSSNARVGWDMPGERERRGAAISAGKARADGQAFNV